MMLVLAQGVMLFSKVLYLINSIAEPHRMMRLCDRTYIKKHRIQKNIYLYSIYRYSPANTQIELLQLAFRLKNGKSPLSTFLLKYSEKYGPIRPREAETHFFIVTKAKRNIN
jgi:hypothetical protein